MRKGMQIDRKLGLSILALALTVIILTEWALSEAHEEQVSWQAVNQQVIEMLEQGSGPAATLTPGIININEATQKQFEGLPGIGPSKAKAIVEHRTEHGPFKEIEDLRQVKGIGAKTFENLKEHLTLDAP